MSPPEHTHKVPGSRCTPLGLERHCLLSFDRPAPWRRRMTFEAVLRSVCARPPYVVGRRPGARQQWAVFFAYAPDGQPNHLQIDTLTRLRDDGWPILLIISSAEPTNLDPQWLPLCEAWIWKGLAGYDFSAYTLALELLAVHSEGAQILLLNDSVFGPFHSCRQILQRCDADLVGFTGSGSPERHLQSYAFTFRAWSRQDLRRLRTVFWSGWALNGRDDVILTQELRLARRAARFGTCMALWYLESGDPTQAYPLELLDDGMPFLKKSLLSARSSFADKSAVEAVLDRLDVPWR